MSGEPFVYPGSELELFRDTMNWKAYWAAIVGRYLGARVLEVGAGIGGSTKMLCHGSQKLWLCIEPDRRLAAILEERKRKGELATCCVVRNGSVKDLSPDERFDSILYLDVLEHIEDDAGEIRRVSSQLVPGGHLIVLAPAHEWLFTAFDRQIGHFRRYTRASLGRLAPPGFTQAVCRYVDSAGLLASICNRVILRSSMPTKGQLWLWDTFMIRLSRLLDPILLHRVGKSVIIVWRRGADAGASGAGLSPSGFGRNASF